MSPPTAYRPTHPLSAAKPTRTLFDPWNSSSTGHQRAENRLSGSTSWRDSRSAKLGEQFKDGQRGVRRLADTVSAGSGGSRVDGRMDNGAWVRGASGLRMVGQKSIVEAALGGGKVEEGSRVQEDGTAKVLKPSLVGKENQARESKQGSHRREKGDIHASPLSVKAGNKSEQEQPDPTQRPPPQIFRNLRIYINGSTYPLISDHKLKRLLASHGARVSIALGRRSVTHVILGRPNGSTSVSGLSGAGGGLAGSKIQKEISRVGSGNGIKFVGPEWVLESIAAGRRLPEGRFGNLKVAQKGQGSVWDVFGLKERGA